MCTFRKYPYSPTEGIGNSREGGGSQRPKNLKQCMKLNWNFQRGGGGGGHGQIPGMEISGITQFKSLMRK